MEIRLRRCKRCAKAIVICGPCDLRRRYCVECSPEAERERLARAWRTYRDSPEGKAQHAAEEKDRRQRRKRESVGDRHRVETSELGTVRCQEVVLVPEPLSTGVRPAAPAPPMEAEPAVAHLAAAEAAPVLSAGREVTLAFSRALRAMAKALLGTAVVCCACGRRGVVTRLRLETKRRRR